MRFHPKLLHKLGILAAHKVCTATAKLAKKNLKDIKVHWLRLSHQLNVAMSILVVLKVEIFPNRLWHRLILMIVIVVELNRDNCARVIVLIKTKKNELIIEH